MTAPAASTVEDRLSRGLLVLRVVVLIDAAVFDLAGLTGFRHPSSVVGCLVVMAAWTAVTGWAYAAAPRRRPVLLVLDLGVAVTLVLLTPLLKGPEFVATVPGFWVVGATMAWALRYRWVGGLVAGVAVAAADLSVRSSLDQANTGNLVLLLISGPIVGFMVESLVRMAQSRDVAQREAASMAERARLARAVHDGVLQVLALAQRRGNEPGGDLPLGRLAGEQEAALRLLIREQEAVTPAGNGTADLAAALVPLQSRPGVEVVTPGGAVTLARPVVTELVAAVCACLDNVVTHVGAGAPAWVLLEDWPDRVAVSVRDEGPGIPAGRLAQAAADGRLGASQSVQGRLADLGGTATLSSSAQGTEWELSVPRQVEGGTS